MPCAPRTIGDSHLFIDFWRGLLYAVSHATTHANRHTRPAPQPQRGNNRQDVFFVDGYRAAYLDLLREQCLKHRVRVLGYIA